MSAATPASSSSIDVSSPYYLGSSDNPGTVLVSSVFNGNGFSSWKRSMTIALAAKNKIAFVDGSISRPPLDDSNYSTWFRVNSMVISWLLNSLHPTIAQSVLFLQTANEIWKELNHRYEQTDGALIYQIQQQLYSISQGSDDFPSYFTKLMKVLDELSIVQSIPPYTCAAATSIHKFLDDQRLIQLLMGLNDTYKVLRGQILMMKPLPSVFAIYSMIVQEERQREINLPHTINPEAIAMQISTDHSSNSSKKTLTCSHCKKSGYSKAQCYRLIGFLATFKFTKSKKDEPKSTVQMATTESSPTISQDQYENLLQLINNSTIQSSSSNNDSLLQNGAMNSDGTASFSFVHFASNVYKSSSYLKRHISFIIDSGATDHMCSNPNLFLSMTQFSQPHTIGLPNGFSLIVSHYGDVRVHDSILLQHVLYVPSFKFNLVSVTKLTKKLQSFVLFTDETCLMQDPLHVSCRTLCRRINSLLEY
ncbi:hypothetical protein L2E82_45478 [Cichorium intybus]|uniref:Uncharacterized protein n=1 Tax=Cichorium intybus TaxID=13427 RepID=A0ACB8ZU27_CICIN|nr:hypothetical protein L2E82_45478 [Cichorium intybus]